jgi:histidinol-phosphatase
VQNLVDASFSFSDQEGWDPVQFEAIRSATWRQRAYGDFWSHTLLAEGAVDLGAEPELALYDYAALVPIVTEAGGRVSQFNGDDLPVDENESQPSFLSTNGLLHRACIDLFNNKT